MPPSSSFGISTLLHIGVIACMRLFGKLPVKLSWKKGSKPGQAASAVIIAIVTAITFSASAQLVHESVTESHSSILIAKKYINAADTMFSQRNAIASGDANIAGAE